MLFFSISVSAPLWAVCLPEHFLTQKTFHSNCHNPVMAVNYAFTLVVFHLISCSQFGNLNCSYAVLVFPEHFLNQKAYHSNGQNPVMAVNYAFSLSSKFISTVTNFYITLVVFRLISCSQFGNPICKFEDYFLCTKYLIG